MRQLCAIAAGRAAAGMFTCPAESILLKIHAWWMAPELIGCLAQEAEVSGCSAMRHVLVGGEALPPALAGRFQERWSNAHLHNAYGPTETTVDATGYDVTAEFKGGASVPIGQPIANMRCYVLDAQQQLVPVGMPGELMVSGIQLARGYLKRPDLTAEKFIPNPYSAGDQHHDRLYRTGVSATLGCTITMHVLACTFLLSHIYLAKYGLRR